MEKMRMESVDMTVQNVDKIAALFPNCITEALDEEKSTPEKNIYKKVVNFDLLRQMLSGEVLEGDEAYEFTWVGKKAAIVEANKPIRKTLRPCPEESVDWDITGNLYIEGDNLEVLKLLQESYLGKVKMIYIDPPYNTGNDFVYADDFRMSAEEWEQESALFNESGDRLIRNTGSNGRFHSDWCSMIYSRLLLARNLLRNDGAIFISIDDREQENLKKICNEIFGESNCVGVGQWRRVEGKPGKAVTMARTSEFVLIYAKSAEQFTIGTLPLSEDGLKEFRYSDKKGQFRRGQIYYPNRGIHHYSVVSPYGNTIEGDFTVKEDVFKQYIEEDKIYWAEQGEHTPYLKIYLSEFGGVTPTNTFGKEYGSSQSAVKEFKKIFNTSEVIFDNPKPTKLIKRLLMIGNLGKDDIVMDFFAGSSTTAHALMQLNAEDGGKRKFIMVQLPEECDEKTPARKLGYHTICDIGKSRITLSANAINKELESKGEAVDGGFRVLKLDDSNMNEVYYSAGEYTQGMLSLLESNVKSDRTDLDLLFSCLLEWGLPLSMPYKSEDIEGCRVHTYNDGDLIACFDENVPNLVIKEIAKRQPLRAVFRDSSFNGSPAKINVSEIFKMLAPDSRVKVI